MCRWQHALAAIEQLTSSLATLQLEAAAAGDDCEMLRALCLAGLGAFGEAESTLRRLARTLIDEKLKEGADKERRDAAAQHDNGDSRAAGARGAGVTWSRGHQRVRYLTCVKAAGSVREILQDFVSASADYLESSQTWTLAPDLISPHHPFVAEANFCATRARWRGGLVTDLKELEAQVPARRRPRSSLRMRACSHTCLGVSIRRRGAACTRACLGHLQVLIAVATHVALHAANARGVRWSRWASGWGRHTRGCRVCRWT